MSIFAPVCPSRVLKQLAPRNSGNYHLLLAHDVAKDPGYGEFFDKLHMYTVIMDNSVIELGNAVDLGVIKQACHNVPPTTVVLPDVLLDAKATVDSCQAALVEWRSAFADLLDKPIAYTSFKRGFMIVPQGNTIEEWAWCAEQFKNEPNINFWGIPRNLVSKIGTRRDAIEIAHALNPERVIHLLGFSDNIIDDVICARSRFVEGIDSAVPLRIASEGHEMSFVLKTGPRGTWWDTCEFNPRMDTNIEMYRQWIRRAH